MLSEHDLQFKKSLKILFFSMIVVLAATAVFNYIMDPACLFNDGAYEAGVAKLLFDSKNVANVGNYDERLVQKIYIHKLDKSPQVVVIGSSRAMEIRSSFFKNKSFFNNSVSGASLEDIIAIYQLYHLKGLKPETVVLGLDPWLLNENSEQLRWHSLEREYYSAPFINATTNIAKKQSSVSRYKELITLPYLMASFEKLKMKVSSQQIMYYETQDKIGISAIKLADGSLVNDEKTRTRNVNEVRGYANDYAGKTPIYSLGGFHKLNNNQMKIFEAYIDYLQKQDIEVIFFLPPYHPLVYGKISKDPKYRMVIESENFFRHMAKIRNVKLYGSYNPEPFGCKDDDFFDGMHPKESLVKKMLNKISN